MTELEKHVWSETFREVRKNFPDSALLEVKTMAVEVYRGWEKKRDEGDAANRAVWEYAKAHPDEKFPFDGMGR